MEFRNIEAVRVIVKESTGLDITYAYEDLVFPENMAFIIQFDDNNAKNLFCFFHTDCNPSDKTEILERMVNISSDNDFTLEDKGKFDIRQKNQEVDINFIV